MQLNRGITKRRQAISLTPLIDVVFILLLFFMLSSSFIPWRQINVSMPTATLSSDNAIAHLEILDNQGGFQFENHSYPRLNQTQLRALVLQYPEHVFLIKAKPQVQTGVLVSLLDQLTLAGAKDVSIASALKGN